MMLKRSEWQISGEKYLFDGYHHGVHRRLD
jgi:hypothetical protein